MTDWLEELMEETGEMLRWGLGSLFAAEEAAGQEEELGQPGKERKDPPEGWGGAHRAAETEERAGLRASQSLLAEGSSVLAGEETDLQAGQVRRPGGDGSGLYRRLARAGRRARAVRAPEGSAAAERQSVGSPSLTVDELDRAVRRDSRRYDGGMELY